MLREKNTPKEEALLLIASLRERILAQLDSPRRILDFCLATKEFNSQVQEHSTITEQMDALYQEALQCHDCPLSMTRKNLVFGEGNAHAQLMFIGEAPGADEDEQGRPFVGKAGQLLTKIIEAMRIKREDVYICNILKCRPPGNRNPLPEEATACLPKLLKQIELVSPKIICALGAVPAHTLLGISAPISVLRGRFHDYNGIKVMPTFHPAYLLRNPAAKKSVWEDMQTIMKELGL
ncbi:MAG: uracil-DNA glycosylase [Deltaproteobacteria bacterium]|nr:uracil-DNA glycosylase [Deltaproteobacteria bacterium]